MFYSAKHKNLIYACFFSFCLAVTFMFFIFSALYHADPLVLGTEMNTNGMVEYLCLGRGCENLHLSRW